MAEEENRIETVKRHKGNLQRIDSELSDLKGDLIRDIDNSREFCEDVDKARDPIKKEIEAIENLPTIKLGEIEEDDWREYEEMVDRREEHLGSFSAIRQDVEKLTSQIPFLDASFNSAANISGSTAVNVVTCLSSMNLDPIYNRKLEELELSDTIVEQIEFIKTELQVIKPDILSDFDSVVKDWSSTSAQKYKTLLAIRSIIFYQLLDTVAKNTNYSRTVWFKQSRFPSSWKRREIHRYCQVKFFILGYNDKSNIPNSSVKIIDNAARNLCILFGKLSEYGKIGKRSDTVIERTFRDTISYFATALKLWEQFFRLSP